MKHRPGGEPITVRHPRTGVEHRLFLHLVYHVNDIRGVPGVVCGRHPPCYVGSCVKCEVAGIRRLNRTILPSAVMALPPADPLRQRFKREFRYDAEVAGLADAGPPRKRTRQRIVAAGRRVLSGESDPSDEPFYAVPCFIRKIDYFGRPEHTVYDLAHTIANFVKLLISVLTNKAGKKKAKFTPSVRSEERNTRRRFPELEDR